MRDSETMAAPVSIENQVVAIGLRGEVGVFELLIAENGVVNPKDISHITRLWGMLERYRTLSGDEKTQLKLEIAKIVYVYVHCYHKLYRRFTVRKAGVCFRQPAGAACWVEYIDKGSHGSYIGPGNYAQTV